MASKFTASPMRVSRVEQPALTLSRKKGFQPRQTSALQDVSNLSSRNAQDDDFSPADSFSLCSNMPQSQHSPQQMESWNMNDAPLMMSSNSSCSSQSTGGDSFETSMISTTEPSPQDSGMFFSSYPPQMLQSSTGQVSNEGPSPNYTPLSELQAMQDITDSPQMAFTQSQGFPDYSPVMDFSSDHGSHLTIPDCCPDDSGLVESKGRTMDDSQMFTGNDAWNPMSMDAELFPNTAVDQLSSLFHPLPVSPPLTEASNDVSVTSACSQSSYPPYPAQDNALFGEVPLPANSGKPENPGEQQYFPATPPMTDEQDPHRTIRAPKQSQRPLVSAAAVRPQLKSGSEYYSGLPITEPLRQRSRDGQESRSPRDHKYYFLPTHSDGKYYCPFASSEKPCSHPPTTQKCAYHKYLDSHLRPYHCKVPQCVDVRFSSNACLFRHEREAHGMHGHGENPHLCLFKDCERSVVGNGFPRRWNLHDHMKRVHDYTSSERVSSPEASTSGSSQSSKKKDNPARKRKGPNANGGATLMKRNRSTQSQKSAKAAQSQAQLDQQLENAQRDYYNCLYRLQSELGKLTPEDADLHETANASLQELHTLGINYRSMQAGKAATQVGRNFSA